MGDLMSVEAIRSALRIAFPVRAWLYVGAGTGQIFEQFSTSDVPVLLAVEARDSAFVELERRIGKVATWHARRALVAAEHGEHNFYTNSIAAESGLVPATALTAIWRNIYEKDRSQVRSVPVSSLLRESELVSSGDFNWLSIDCLPAVAVLGKLDEYVDGLDVIEVRAVQDGLAVSDQARASEVDQFLSGYGFELKAQCSENHPDVQKLFFVRTWRSLFERQRDETDNFEKDLQKLEERMLSASKELKVANELRAQLERANLVLTKETSALLERTTAAQHINTELERERDYLRKSLEEAKKNASMYESLTKNIGQLHQSITSNNNEINSKIESISSAIQSEIERCVKPVKELCAQIYSSNSNIIKTDAIQKMFAEQADLLEGDIVRSRKAIERAVKSEVSNSTRQIEAFIDIYCFLKDGEHLPLLHGWPVSPDFARCVLDMVDRVCYDDIVEFGSGSSTLLIAKALARKSEHDERIPSQTAFEHLENFYIETHDHLVHMDLADCVQLVYAPLKPMIIHQGESYQYYDCESHLAKISKSSVAQGRRLLVIVDGPPASTGAHARYPALPLILKHFKDAKIDVILDDYVREDEKEVVVKWEKHMKRLDLDFSVETLELEKNACLIRIEPAGKSA